MTALLPAIPFHDPTAMLLTSVRVCQAMPAQPRCSICHSSCGSCAGGLHCLKQTVGDQVSLPQQHIIKQNHITKYQLTAAPTWNMSLRMGMNSMCSPVIML